MDTDEKCYPFKETRYFYEFLILPRLLSSTYRCALSRKCIRHGCFYETVRPHLSPCSLIKTYWKGYPFLPEGYRSLPQTTVPLYLSSSGEPQMPISAQILQLFILVLCPRPKLCTGVSSFTYGREFHENY